jgi:hypothetical protein
MNTVSIEAHNIPCSWPGRLLAASAQAWQLRATTIRDHYKPRVRCSSVLLLLLLAYHDEHE